MQPLLIRLTYRHVTDTAAGDDFTRAVLRLSYDEFKIKSQAYNAEGKFSTFTEMKAADGRANSLHYKCSFAIANLVESLKKKNPFLTDELDRGVDFATFAFEVIESSINDPSQHKVAVHFITGDLQLVLSCGDRLVLQQNNASADGSTGFKDTFTLRMREGLSVTGWLPG